MNRTDVLAKQIESANNAKGPELRQHFTMLYGFEPGVTNVSNLRKRVIYKIQEINYGGLSDADKALLAKLAEADPIANLKEEPGKERKARAGMRIQRDWKGKTYEVTVCKDGKYEFNGETYRSLSAIADLITGSHWNGKKFFGVK